MDNKSSFSSDIWQRDLADKLDIKQRIKWTKILEPKIRKVVDKIDRAAIRVIVDFYLKNFSNFYKFSKNYWFHIPTGYLLHIFDWNNFKNALPRFGYIKLGTHKQCPGRRLILALRRKIGPRGGKYIALASLTHVSTNPAIVSNRLTRMILMKCKRFALKNKLVYPNYYVVEKRFYKLPFNKYRGWLRKVRWPK